MHNSKTYVILKGLVPEPEHPFHTALWMQHV